jgi:hypothetical protein
VTAGAAPAAPAAAEPVRFPSLAWFELLAARMNANRPRQEQLGYVDCVVAFTVSDGGPGSTPWTALVTFEEFSATEVRQAASGETGDFSIAAPLVVWREMIESIAHGRGRPDLDQTLNRLSHFGTPIAVTSDDPLKRDLYFRYNQSLQEFVNASAAFRTEFAG